MSYQDKQITCSDCGTTFTFSAGEQESFASRGYTNDPKRCPLAALPRSRVPAAATGHQPHGRCIP